MTMKQWRQKARELKKEIYALYYACQDGRIPWYVKFLASCAIAYALSPIDLIPDFIPVLGLLDDLILLPLAITLILKLIPTDIMDDCCRQAETALRCEARDASASPVVARRRSGLTPCPPGLSHHPKVNSIVRGRL